MPTRTLEERMSGLEAGQRLLEAGHDAQAQRLEDIAGMIQQAVAEGMKIGIKAVIDDPKLLDSFWAAAVDRGQRGLHEKAGAWLFSKWTVVIALVFMMGQVIGWPAVIKAIFGIGLKGGA